MAEYSRQTSSMIERLWEVKTLSAVSKRHRGVGIISCIAVNHSSGIIEPPYFHAHIEMKSIHHLLR